MSGGVDRSPEGRGSARGSQRHGRPPHGFRPSLGAPEGLSSGPGGSAWERQFEAENQRRRREVRQAEDLLNSRDQEPGRTADDQHEIVWITPALGCCPLCCKTYRRAKVPTDSPRGGVKYVAQSAPDMDQYMRSAGLFTAAGKILDQRQAERKAAADEKERKRRGGPPADYHSIVHGDR